MAVQLGIFSLLSLLSATVSFGIGIFVYAKNPKNTIHQMFFLTCASASYWAFMEYMTRISENPESAAFWLKAGAIWIFIPVFVLHFMLIYTESPIIRDKWRYVTYASMYVPSMIFTITEITTDLISTGPQLMSWGYTYSIAENPTIYIIESSWAMLMILLSLLVCLRHFFRATDRKREQAKYMTIALAFPFVAALWSMAATPGMPDMIIASILFYVYIVASAMWKYRLFEVTPESTAEEIIETMNDLLLLLDQDKRIISVNNAAAVFLGHGTDDLSGMPLSSIIQDEGAIDEIYRKTLESGSLSDFETFLYGPGADRVPVSCSCSEIMEPDGNFAGIVLIARDITRRKMDEAAILQASEKLKLLNSITRHDMLNQLTALNGYLLLSEGMSENENMKKYIGHCLDSAGRLFEQINFTKDYQDIGIKSPEWMDAGRTIARIAETFGDRPEIECLINDFEIYVDPLFERVIYNLIDNSIRHGECVTRIFFSAHESKSGLEIVCGDNGAGITAEDKPRLFQRGFGKNTGLGLFLSSEILSITGITISETGEPGVGARFVMHVPPGKYRFTG